MKITKERKRQFSVAKHQPHSVGKSPFPSLIKNGGRNRKRGKVTWLQNGGQEVVVSLARNGRHYAANCRV